MTQSEPNPQQQLEHAIDDVHIDALRHPDPSGRGLLRLLAAVRGHIRDETPSVLAYARLGRETSDPIVAVVMELLVEEEERHHTLLERIASSLQDRLDWAMASSALPLGAEPASRTEHETAQTVRALEDEERRGAQALRDLAHREVTEETGLACLLLETMAMDSDKHAHLLAFVAERLAGGQSTR